MIISKKKIKRKSFNLFVKKNYAFIFIQVDEGKDYRCALMDKESGSQTKINSYQRISGTLKILQNLG